MRNLTLALIVSASLGGGFLLGSQARPETEMSQLASAQLLSQDKRVEWIGYSCGDDGAAIISPEMPDFTECRGGVRRLNENVATIDLPMS